MSRIVDEKDYAKGFNLGYQLADLSPEISNIVSEISSKDDRIYGMQQGIEQYNLEIQETIDKTQDKAPVKKNAPSWMKEDRIENIDKETSQNKGKDMDKDIEPEI